MDCGPACLRMVAKFYGRTYNIETLRTNTNFHKGGVSLLGLSEGAEEIGLRSRGVKLSLEQLEQIPLPAILHWNSSHFVVLYKIGRKKITVADPAADILHFTKRDFIKYWGNLKDDNGQTGGIALMLEPTNKFYELHNEIENKISWKLALNYLKSNRWRISQVIIALAITSCLQLLFPFLTQSIVDFGINADSLHFVVIVLLAQLMLTLSQTSIDFIRSRLLLKIGMIVNLSILSDFWIKITKLPLSHFDKHHTGDTIQRLQDNRVIQNFITGTALVTIFSFITFVVFALILLIYHLQLFIVFSIGTAIYFVWIRSFLKIQRKINYEVFDYTAKENNATLQMIQGMHEIRLNNAERTKRWEWENIQVKIFKFNLKSLSYAQLQQAGGIFINQTKNLAITFIVADLVIKGQLTLGSMLAIQYIIGQLNSPVEMVIGFIREAQDAKISMERINEIHGLKDEEEPVNLYSYKAVPAEHTIIFKNVSFTYPGADKYALDDISLELPEGKITAIVGTSGSGKTTILKLLLGFYNNYQGNILVGGNDFRSLRISDFRSACGSVLQDGYIFNDTIEHNITIGKDVVDRQRMMWASKMANIHPFIESLPNSYSTQLGVAGIGLSAGQRQRLLIARAIYKDPPFLFFDEATNALDANNEKSIVENLNTFFDGKTVLIIAHRLSTVKNADKIVVIAEGKIVEEGTHRELTRKQGKYYHLVKDQLDLEMIET